MPVNSIDILRVNTQISILSNEVLHKRVFILLSFYTLKSFRTATINVKNLQTLIDPKETFALNFRMTAYSRITVSQFNESTNSTDQ